LLESRDRGVLRLIVRVCWGILLNRRIGTNSGGGGFSEVAGAGAVAIEKKAVSVWPSDNGGGGAEEEEAGELGF
jgi:hypothetical protein